MPDIKKLLLLISTVLINVFAIAQTSSPAPANNGTGAMEVGGKIYVVMVIVLTILAGFLFYVVRLDRKISKLEKRENINR